MKSLSRRDALKTGLLAAGSLPVFGGGLAAASNRAGAKFDWGHTIDFGEQYYRNMIAILNQLRQNELPLIGELSGRMTRTLKKGGNVWMQANAGHMGRFAFAEDVPGNPGILRSTTQWAGADYDQMKEGDVLVTNYVSEDVKAARDKGVYVVGVPVCYIDNKNAPRGYVQPNPNGWFLEDVSNVILESYIPYHQGIVKCPEIPMMEVFPSSANSLHSIYWMFQCEAAYKLKNKVDEKYTIAKKVIDTIISRIEDAWRLQRNSMCESAAIVAQRIGNGAHFHVTSDHPGVQEESNRVAMGPMMTNAFRDNMKEGDVHLLASIPSQSNMLLAEARKAREMGMYTIVIAPSNALELRPYADIFIDNLSPEEYGFLDIDGFDEKVGVLSGVVNNTLMWIYTAQFVDEMVRRGKIPYFYMGYYRVGGREYTEAVKPFFFEQGY